jgi:hypothetical protein
MIIEHPKIIIEYRKTKAEADKLARQLKKQGYKVNVYPAGYYRGAGWNVRWGQTTYGVFCTICIPWVTWNVK